MLINCFSVNGSGTKIPEQCQDCAKLKACLELNAIKQKECKSRDTDGVYDPLADFR